MEWLFSVTLSDRPLLESVCWSNGKMENDNSRTIRKMTFGGEVKPVHSAHSRLNRALCRRTRPHPHTPHSPPQTRLGLRRLFLRHPRPVLLIWLIAPVRFTRRRRLMPLSTSSPPRLRPIKRRVMSMQHARNQGERREPKSKQI